MVTIKRAVTVTGVAERLTHSFQNQKMQRLHRGQRVRRHAVPNGIEGHFVQERTPSRIHFVTGTAIAVVVQATIPAVAWNPGNRTYLVKNVLPVPVEIPRLGKHARHSNDRNIALTGRATFLRTVRRLNYLRLGGEGVQTFSS